MHPRGLLAGKRLIFIAAFLLGTAPLLTVSSAEPPSVASVSSPSVTVVLSIEGRVEVLRQGATDWEPAKLDQKLEAGHRLRTGAKSRAMLRLSNLSVLRVGELMEYEIQPPRSAASRLALTIKAGIAYFFSRDKPRELEIRTPIATGAIRGTEFNIAVAADGQTTLTLVDGEVELSTAQGSVVITNGEQAVAQPGQPPSKTAVINAVNIIQWNLYYPAVIDLDELGLSNAEQQALASSFSAYRSGDLLDALAKYPAGRTPGSSAEKIYQAQLFLAVGAVKDAQDLLATVSSDSEKTGRLASALRQLISAVTLQLIEGEAAPTTASEWLAQSYYLQSNAQLHEALVAARNAVSKSPEFAYGWERVAELEFSFGHAASALEALNKSLGLAPRNAQAVALKGFLVAAQNRIREAQQLFDDAIALDGALGNAWLGRGLCRIREGRAREGREDLEVAAALEPNRALLRSYLSKAFSEVGDNRRAEHELKLARAFDPNDPTSWLYSALLRQQQNRINEAIADLETSQALNENRRIYRSRFLLDQDAAVRGANLASIYRDAGMDDLSVREATRAVNSDYANYSAHLFLANSYNQLRDPNQINLRYETPWLSEYLIANLLAPVGAGTLSQTVSQQDYSKLFERNGLGIASSTEYFSRGDWIQAGSQYGTFGNFGYAVDTLYRSRNGWRPNNNHEDLTLSLQIKQQITSDDIIFVQALYYDASGGDLNQYYDQSQAHTGFRFKETQEPIVLAGYNHQWAPGVHTLVLAGRFADEFHATDTNQAVLILARNGAGDVIAAPTPQLPTASLDYRSDLEIYSVEGQQIFEQEKHTLIVGARYQTGTFDTASALGPSTPTLLASASATTMVSFASAPISQNFSPDFERIAGYGYYSLRLIEPLLLTGGISYDYLRLPSNFRAPPITGGEESEDRISPKAGLTWTPRKNTTFRFAYTRSLGGVSFDQSVRLEPAQVAGFNQAFRSIIPEAISGSVSGAKFETFGAAFEHKFSTRTYLGIDGQILNSQWSHQIGEVNLNFPPAFVPSGTRANLDYQEKDLLVTLNQLLGDYFSIGARYWVSKADLKTRFPEVPASATPAALATAFNAERDAILHQFGIFGLLNCPCGFFARADALWNYQINEGADSGLANADFWQFNVFAGYRFWQRHAQVQLGLLNISDRDYRLNPLNLYTELPRRRTFTASLQFTF